MQERNRSIDQRGPRVGWFNQERSGAYRSNQEHRGAIRSMQERNRAFDQRGPRVGCFSQERSGAYRSNQNQIGAIRSMQERSGAIRHKIQQSIKDHLVPAGLPDIFGRLLLHSREYQISSLGTCLSQHRTSALLMTGSLTFCVFSEILAGLKVS